MEFTKSLRRHFAANKGKVIEGAILYRESFPQTPYKTFNKLMDRFVKDGPAEDS